jgi:hypothetical protein
MSVALRLRKAENEILTLLATIERLTKERDLANERLDLELDEYAKDAHLASLRAELAKARDELNCRVGDLVMLRRAVDEGDPKRELMVRINDMLRETRAALSPAKPEEPK